MAKIYATLNPSDKGPNTTLSNGNLTATNTTANWDSVRSTIGVSSGKWYWEVTVGTGTGLMNGVANASALLNNFIGSDINGWGYYSGSGNKYNNNTPSAYGVSYTNGDILGFALDMSSGTLTIYKNNVSQGIMVAGLTGIIFPGISSSTSGIPAIQTINFGATPLTYTPPAGFNAGLFNWNDSSFLLNFI